MVVDITGEALATFVERAASLLPADDHRLLQQLVASLLELTRQIRQQGTTIARLRRLVGGLSSEKTEKVLPRKTEDEGTPKPTGSETAPPGGTPSGSAPETKAPGHGRTPSSDYPDAECIPVNHESLTAGGLCPECGHGHLYGLKPAQILRIVGQAPLVPKLWLPERLRCSGCGGVFTAQAPDEAQGPKFTESAIAMMALLRYGNGQPLHRLDHLQGYLKAPIPASTQWQVVSQSVDLFKPVYEELLRLAAQSPLLHNDDTHVRILELMGKRRANKLALGELDHPERTGLFTTGVVAKNGEDRPVVLFFSGRQHAGENLADLLTRRAIGLAAPILMSDALSRNLPQGHAVLEANCLSHGRRNVVDQVSNFPEECRYILEELGKVFEVDRRCRLEGLDPDERLQAHQAKSGPVMERILAKAIELLDGRKVEPNSEMGKALAYLRTHWEALTLFLRVPGAPLSNNECERLLKMAIRHRRNSLFYRSERGAEVGDLYMTLIETTVLNDENPFEYLTVLQRFSKEVAARPADWLPWSFRETLAYKQSGSATPPLAPTHSHTSKRLRVGGDSGRTSRPAAIANAPGPAQLSPPSLG